MEDTKKNIPILVMRGLVLLPSNILKLEVGRDFSKNAVDVAFSQDSYLFVTTQVNPFVEKTDIDNVYKDGVYAKIINNVKLPNGNFRVTLQGIERAHLDNVVDVEPYLEGDISLKASFVEDDVKEVALMRRLASYVEEYLPKINLNNDDVIAKIAHSSSSSVSTDVIAFYLPMTLERKQEYVLTLSSTKRLMMIVEDLELEKQINDVEESIEAQLRHNMEKAQKEYYLREKMRVIKEELGDTNVESGDELLDSINELKLPEKIHEKAIAELKRYNTMPSNSQEASIIRTYLEWVMSIPWNEESEDNHNLIEVEKVLNDSHYGLVKVKERILDYLAVKEMTDSLDSPIICLVGPPGTGKTSLAESIAKALNRSFVKISLGGVRDESEVRGHRRTYLGSMPGRIIQGMKKAKTINPVFLLDEIDKMSSDFRGDPASAMLEVLDPSQNKYFSDNYLEEEYDLSKVLFIATANYYEQIPHPLLDRMEIIDLSSYTEIEKVNIAKEHLYYRQIKKHGLKPEQLTFADGIYLEIIRCYTREAGVRQVEREISKICRKVVRDILTGKFESIEITTDNLSTYLGKKRFDFQKKYEESVPGVVTGLAYTSYGGDILPIEVTFYKGSGKIKLTGSLGDIMKESAHIALSYIKSHHDAFGVDLQELENIDIHIHVPEGATPKDGPSAGITLTTALISALTNKKVDNKVGMTGEITLQGRVLPIGGLREKSISAHRSGLEKILIPYENLKDLEDIPKEVTDALKIVPIKNYMEVHKEMFNG